MDYRFLSTDAAKRWVPGINRRGEPTFKLYKAWQEPTQPGLGQSDQLPESEVIPLPANDGGTSAPPLPQQQQGFPIWTPLGPSIDTAPRMPNIQEVFPRLPSWLGGGVQTSKAKGNGSSGNGGSSTADDEVELRYMQALYNGVLHGDPGAHILGEKKQQLQRYANRISQLQEKIAGNGQQSGPSGVGQSEGPGWLNPKNWARGAQEAAQRVELGAKAAWNKDITSQRSALTGSISPFNYMQVPVDMATNVASALLGAKGSPSLPPNTIAPGQSRTPYEASRVGRMPVVGGAIPTLLGMIGPGLPEAKGAEEAAAAAPEVAKAASEAPGVAPELLAAAKAKLPELQALYKQSFLKGAERDLTEPEMQHVMHAAVNLVHPDLAGLRNTLLQHVGGGLDRSEFLAAASLKNALVDRLGQVAAEHEQTLREAATPVMRAVSPNDEAALQEAQGMVANEQAPTPLQKTVLWKAKKAATLKTANAIANNDPNATADAANQLNQIDTAGQLLTPQEVIQENGSPEAVQKAQLVRIKVTRRLAQAPAVNTVTPEMSAGLQTAMNFAPADVQEAAVKGIGGYVKGFLPKSSVVGFVGGAAFGATPKAYGAQNLVPGQSQSDAWYWHLVNMLGYGMIGAIGGHLLMGHAALGMGANTKLLPARMLDAWVSTRLSTGTLLGVKAPNDLYALLAGPALHATAAGLADGGWKVAGRSAKAFYQTLFDRATLLSDITAATVKNLHPMGVTDVEGRQATERGAKLWPTLAPAVQKSQALANRDLGQYSTTIIPRLISWATDISLSRLTRGHEQAILAAKEWSGPLTAAEAGIAKQRAMEDLFLNQHGQGGTGRLMSSFLAGVHQIPVVGGVLAPFRTVPANALDQLVNHIPLAGELNYLGRDPADVLAIRRWVDPAGIPQEQGVMVNLNNARDAADGAVIRYKPGKGGSINYGQLPKELQIAAPGQDAFTVASKDLQHIPAAHELTLAKQMMGLATFAIGDMLTGGNVNGAGPDPYNPNSSRRVAWLAEGNKAWTARMPNGQWEPIDGLIPPVAAMLRFYGAAQDMQKYGMTLPKGAAPTLAGPYQQPLEQGASELGSALADSRFYPTVLGFLNDAFTGRGNVFTSLKQELGYEVGSLVPAQVSEIARAQQPHQFAYPAKTDTLGQSILTGFGERLPGQGSGLALKTQRATGQLLPNFQQGPAAMLGIHAGTRPVPAKTLDYAVQQGFNLPATTPPRIGPTNQQLALPLTDREQQNYTQLLGHYFDTAASKELSNPQSPLNGSNVTQARERWNSIANDARKVATTALFKQIGTSQLLGRLAGQPQAQSFLKGYLVQQQIAQMPEFTDHAGKPLVNPQQQSQLDDYLKSVAQLSQPQAQRVRASAYYKNVLAAKKEGQFNALYKASQSPNWTDYWRSQVGKAFPEATWNALLSGSDPKYARYVDPVNGKPVGSVQDWMNLDTAVWLYRALPTGDPRKGGQLKRMYDLAQRYANKTKVSGGMSWADFLNAATTNALAPDLTNQQQQAA